MAFLRKLVNADAVPNQDVIRYLIENYYENGLRPRESEYISSHWRYYSELFRVQVDGQGNMVSLSGVGFGRVKQDGFFDRFLDSACVLSHLMHLLHRRELLRLYAIARKTCRVVGLDPTFDVFRQVCSLELIKRNLSACMYRKRLHVLMFGDGYGILSILFKAVFPNSTMVMVDIGKTLLFQAYYCQRAHPSCTHELVDSVNSPEDVDFVYCPAEALETLGKFKFDIAVNIVSMQEMNNSTISRYFDFLRRNLEHDNLFYCSNREVKILQGGEVTKFFEYPWHDEDQFLIDGYCPWQRYFFSRHHAKNGLLIFGIRVPFVNFYDGKIRHRLTVLRTSEK